MKVGQLREDLMGRYRRMEKEHTLNYLICPLRCSKVMKMAQKDSVPPYRSLTAMGLMTSCR